MREEKQQQGGVAVEDAADHTAHLDHAPNDTKFSSSGPFPDVAADVGGSSVSASDRAYGAPAQSSPLLSFGFDGLGSSIGKPRMPTTHAPLSNEEALKALTARKDAEALLKGNGLDASKQAAQALEILLTVSDSQRGKVIDELDDKAFEALLDRIDHAERERFSRLVEVSQKPERKLRLWAEAHKAKATNNVEKHKGDMGGPIATYTWEDEDSGEKVEEIDNDEETEIRKGLTKAQVRNRKRHLRRKTAAESTQGEVDAELKTLMAKSKKGQLTLKDVDDMRERKDLEYQIELDSNVNLTAQDATWDSGEAVHWRTEELKQVQRTLPRLPQAQNPDAFSELHRTKSKHLMDTTGGVHHGDSIDITDWGVSPGAGFRHGNDKRELVSDALKQKDGDAISTLDFVLTHEIGHDAADKDPKAFDAFRKAAGWERVKVDALRADGVTALQITKLEDRRSNPNAKTSDIEGRKKIYSPIEGSKDEYWAVPIGAIPAQDEAAPSPKGDDTWSYARVNPAEHFAETYAKAVHVPEKLHDELIVRPNEVAAKKRDVYEPMKRQLDSLEANKSSSNRELKLANLRPIVGALRSEMLEAEAIRDQRAEQFAIMRNTVFGTDKAVKLSVERLKLKGVSVDKIKEFQERAAVASTPEQVAFLESEVSK